ncbi:MAG: biotin/lipoate A/B protein ligase family protein [Candidatus Dormibacteria bacterium]
MNPPLLTKQLQVRVDGGASGAENMRRDMEMVRQCANGAVGRVLRLYWFDPPCLSIGRMQQPGDVDVEACRRNGIDVVQRPSGGRAVLHLDEVTYALVCRTDDPDFGGDVLTSCARMHEAVARGLRALGAVTTPHSVAGAASADARASASVADCFARPAAHELLDSDGAKLVGSAQARLGGALLQHGSVLLQPSRAARYLREASDHRSAARDAPSTRGLYALAGRRFDRSEVAAALAAGFSQISSV